MSCYVSSNDNRVYVAREQAYGAVAAVTEQNRIAAVRLSARQRGQRIQRRDKTGTRTYQGLPGEIRRETEYELTAYLTGWTGLTGQPNLGPLVGAALGGATQTFAGGTVQSASGLQVTLTGAHGLEPGQAVAHGGEMRFVASVASAQSIVLNAPFSEPLQAGAALGKTITYQPGWQTGSVSLYDYWGGSGAVSRVLAGAAVDQMRIKVNGDLHEFQFRGPSQELFDTASFEHGEGGMTAFPAEPAQTNASYELVPGHLGQAWLGSTASQFLTVTGGEVRIENGIETERIEFGSATPRCLQPGERRVLVSFSIFEQNNAATRELYQAARQRLPIQVMLQLGERPGQLFGVYCHSVVPETPDFDDSETRLQWRFEGRAQGGKDDEIRVAFG
jgi:hypothetical protein